MEISVKGKKVLVTGAGRGVGRAVTEILVKAGASKVFAIDLLQEELNKLAAEVPNVHPILLDLSDWPATEATLSKIEPVDCLVNNAGICWMTEPGEIKESDFDKIFAVNAKAIINVTQIISNAMVMAEIKGSIVNVSSVLSMKSFPPLFIYSAAKATVDHITRNFASSLAPKGIRVNAINPHAIMTPLMAQVVSNPEDFERLAKAMRVIQYLQPEEVGKIILFLLSDWSSTISGATLPVDFGFMAG